MKMRYLIRRLSLRSPASQGYTLSFASLTGRVARCCASPASQGYTLLEAVIAMAIWGMLSAALLFAWSYTSRVSLDIVETQDHFENARIALDGILVNIQLAEEVDLRTDENFVLNEIILKQPKPPETPHPYDFKYNINRLPTDIKYQRLEFNDNEFASQIASVVIRPDNDRRMTVTVVSGGEKGFTCAGSVDIRYKKINVTHVP